MYVLTEEGRKYLKNGLPEKNLSELLEKNSLEMSKAKNYVDNFAIALQWCKKKHLVEVKNGVLFLKNKSDFPEQAALGCVETGKEIDEKIADVLLQRRLIETQRETQFKKAEKLVGKEITNITEDLIKTGLWTKVEIKPFNVEAAGKKLYIGKRQPYSKFISDVKRKMVEMGFIEMTGPTIETEFWNFDALYQPQNHPSRSWTQTYSLKYPKRGDLPDKKITENVKAVHENGWKTGSIGWGYKWDPQKAANLMPRAHDTAISPRYMSKGVKIPGKYFSLVRCYRPDIIDRTHGVEFNQMGGFVIDNGLTFKDLLGLLKQFVHDFAGIERVKFMTDYFPFTEPSVQVSGFHPEMGWIELAGAGMFREELTKPLGIDAPVIAWGFGLDRLAMYKLGINDIREMFSQNLDWLRNMVVS
ncbi:phenylalanine--tRNA ligase subunit alpha [archaeon]|nr:phenylalanine--tRNA ligase subunit alpha [archaeon]